MYPIEDDFGLGHPTPTLLLDHPTLYDDYDYDDYILLPLTLPGVLIPLPARAAEEPYSELPTQLDQGLDLSEFEDDDDDEETLLSPPTYTMLSDYVFPDVESPTSDFTGAGYSKLFRTGLALKSRRITRHFDVWLNKLKVTLSRLVRLT